MLTLVGDGSFQMTAQDVSTMLRYGLTPIILLVCVGGVGGGRGRGGQDTGATGRCRAPHPPQPL